MDHLEAVCHHSWHVGMSGGLMASYGGTSWRTRDARGRFSGSPKSSRGGGFPSSWKVSAAARKATKGASGSSQRSSSSRAAPATRTARPKARARAGTSNRLRNIAGRNARAAGGSSRSRPASSTRTKTARPNSRAVADMKQRRAAWVRRSKAQGRWTADSAASLAASKQRWG